jgi:hypothetical protein
MKAYRLNMNPRVMKCLALAGALALAAGCVERQVVYVPRYQPPPPGPPPPVQNAPQATYTPPSGAPPPAEPGPDPNSVVAQAPPAPQVEAVPVSPGPTYYWVPGYWNWSGRGWIWVGGGWHPRPWHGAVWVGGHWAHHNHGWVWIGGNWR